MAKSAKLDQLTQIAEAIDQRIGTQSDFLVRMVLQNLRGSDPGLEGKTYGFSGDNTLGSNYLIQNKPGQSSSDLLRSVQLMIAQFLGATDRPHFVDIAHLANNNPDDALQHQIVDALLAAAAHATAPLTIRYLEGDQHHAGQPHTIAFAAMVLAASATMPANPNVRFYFGDLDMRWIYGFDETLPGSWNHSKTFAIDGAAAIIGGMNFWDDYLPGHNPLFDVALRVDGSAAAYDQLFTDRLWEGVAQGGWSSHASLALGDRSLGSDLPPSFGSTFGAGGFSPSGTGKVPVLTLGNLGLWEEADQRTLAYEFAYSDRYERIALTKGNYTDKANVPLYFPFSKFDWASARARQASSTARHLALSSVQQGGHLRISQQKIADTDIAQTGYVLWPGNFLDDVAAALTRGAKVDILLSEFGDGAGGYSDDMGGTVLASVIAGRVGAEANANLTVKQVPWGQYNHGKVWIVDDAAFFVGSDNIYPGYLQENGFMVADQASTQRFIADYWDPLWALAVTPTEP